MNLFRLKVQNTSPWASNGLSSRLLEDQGHWGSFVEKTELSVWVFLIPRVCEDSSVEKGSVDITDHRSNVSRAVFFSTLSLSFLQVVDVRLKLRVPVEVVGFVHRVDFTAVRDLHVRMREDEFANGRVEREPVEAGAGGNDEDCRRRVHAVTCGHEVLARLEGCFEAVLLRNAKLITIWVNQAFLWGLEDSEDGSSGDCSVNVG
mmetsp:Transcript_33393/g.81074  ORF Transcript_33393/g.81074 Transcript_33393/m.81074 type:complete len:204 (-) Transcript_33393:601-1212(-)